MVGTGAATVTRTGIAGTGFTAAGGHVVHGKTGTYGIQSVSLGNHTATRVAHIDDHIRPIVETAGYAADGSLDVTEDDAAEVG